MYATVYGVYFTILPHSSQPFSGLSQATLTPPPPRPEELDFVVLMGSFVCGHTVRSAGFMNLPGVAIQRLSRSGGAGPGFFEGERMG